MSVLNAYGASLVNGNLYRTVQAELILGNNRSGLCAHSQRERERERERETEVLELTHGPSGPLASSNLYRSTCTFLYLLSISLVCSFPTLFSYTYVQLRVTVCAHTYPSPLALFPIYRFNLLFPHVTSRPLQFLPTLSLSQTSKVEHRPIFICFIEFAWFFNFCSPARNFICMQ